MVRQNTLITCILTLAVLLSVLCLYWHFTFPVVVAYHRMVSPSCSLDGTSTDGFRRCYLISFGITRQRCLNWGVNPKMIGIHSIRKGAVTYMSSLPGGPSILSVCRVDHGDCEGYLHAVFIIGRLVCWLLSCDVALIADGVWI